VRHRRRHDWAGQDPLSLRVFFFGIGAAAVAVGTTAALPWYREQPPLAHTGGFYEPTCLTCHQGEPLNQPPGSVQLLGLPDKYEPGQELSLTLLLTAPGLRVGGFQLTARFRDGRHAGRFQVGDRRAAVARAESGVEYVSHTREGTAAGKDTIRWSIQWTAPARANGDVLFHFAGNASNDDASPLGDHIHLGQAVLAERPQVKKSKPVRERNLTKPKLYP
ncbi:MAG TPA: choice-of-anchor V domain-containing protein, partial [Longimicrobiales bacterium]|nr:choice-of-anchor V domain-containing protein [Longimicrobiales bacterium]